MSACRRQCAPIRPRAVVPATSSALRNNRPIQRKVHPGDHPSIAPLLLSGGRENHLPAPQPWKGQACPACFREGPRNWCDKRAIQVSPRGTTRRWFAGLLQFQDKQSVRMATRGDHLHYSKQKPGTEPHQNVHEQIDETCRRPRPNPSIVPASVP